MLKYRLSEDTDEHFEGIEGRELTLFIIHKDISYECVISNDYDINNCISVIDQFIIKPHDDYPDVIIISYGSTTLRLLPVNLSYKQLHNEIQILKQRICQLENAECKVQMQIPTHIPAFHALAAEIVYEHWDNLDDLLAVYPLGEIKEYMKYSSQVLKTRYSTAEGGGLSTQTLMMLGPYDNIIITLFDNLPELPCIKIPINTFDLDDELSCFIDLNNHDFIELTTSCKSQFINGDNINKYILKYIEYMVTYHIVQMIRTNNVPDLLINCYISKDICTIKIYNVLSKLYIKKRYAAFDFQGSRVSARKHTCTFRFYINDFTKCKYTVCI